MRKLKWIAFSGLFLMILQGDVLSENDSNEFVNKKFSIANNHSQTDSDKSLRIIEWSQILFESGSKLWNGMSEKVLQELCFDNIPTIYFSNGKMEVQNDEQSPRRIISDIESANKFKSSINSESEIEVIVFKLDEIADFKKVIECSVFDGMKNLRLIHVIIDISDWKSLEKSNVEVSLLLEKLFTNPNEFTPWIIYSISISE